MFYVNESLLLTNRYALPTVFFVAVLCNGTGNQHTKLVPSRPQLPDYYTATKRLAERRGQQVISQTDDVIGRRARSCDPPRDSSSTPPSYRQRSARAGSSDRSEDGRNF